MAFTLKIGELLRHGYCYQIPLCSVVFTMELFFLQSNELGQTVDEGTITNTTLSYD
jgi:hypothetical protein